MPNFSFLAYLEVAEKFGGVVVVDVERVATMSNINPSYFRVALS